MQKDSDEVRYRDEPDDPPKSVSHSYTVERALRGLPAVSSWIRMLSEMVAYRLRKQGLEANTAYVYLREESGLLSREKNFHSPTADPARLFHRSMRIIETFNLRRFCVRALGVGACGLVQAEGPCLVPQDQRRKQLLSAVDAINERFSEWTVYPAAIDSVKKA